MVLNISKLIRSTVHEERNVTNGVEQKYSANFLGCSTWIVHKYNCQVEFQLHWNSNSTLFVAFLSLSTVEQTGLGIQLSSGKTVGGMLFADDFCRY